MAHTVYRGNADSKRMVAVYGSLRVGEGNEWVNTEADARYLGQGKTLEDFNLYEHHGKGFPHVSLKHNDSETQVVVDVFEITQEQLTTSYDGLEGYPSFYNRSEVVVEMYNGDMTEAWIYHIDEDYPVPVRCGDWVTYLQDSKEGVHDF
jgi:gamma-glutamylcyclotransferase (GGCT)/AIG2-like uncharacterized protein YtfP